MALYSPNLWRHLENGLAELRTGRGDTLLVLADMYMRRDARALHQLLGRPGGGQLRGSAGHHRSGHHRRRGPPDASGRAVHELRRVHRPRAAPTCAFWPVPPTSKPHSVSAPGLPPPLVVSTTRPGHPYQAGVDLAQQLGGALLTFEGTQHTVVFQGNKCVDDYAAAYLLDNTLPPPGAVCR
jgi:hypothetical protein